LNNFGSAEKHVKLLVSVFQGLFPPIHVQTMHLSQARRIVLLHYNEATQTIEWRHYLISVRPVGVSRRVRRVIEGSSNNRTASLTNSISSSSKKIPNLSSARDISEYLLGSQNGAGGGEEGGFETDASSASEADSDVEEGGKASNHVQLPDSYIGRGNVRDSQRAVRLMELGPRMELRCVKIEEGIPGAGKEAKGKSSGGNDVLWHDYVTKSSSESNKQRMAIIDKERERKKRREEQEENVQRKKLEKEALKTSKRGKQAETKDVGDGEADEGENSLDEQEVEEEEDDDDEFAYEDMHNKGQGGEREALFEEDDDIIDDDDSIGEESEGEVDLNDDEDEDDDENHDESDLSPIEVGFEDLDSESEEEEEIIAKKQKGNAKAKAKRA
jgi:ribosome biogenesis protein SSF1/2